MLKLLVIVWLTAEFSASAGGTLESGRTVTGYSDSWAVSCGYDEETATITSDGHRIVVEPNQLTIDGNVWIPIDDATKAVEVRLRRSKITLVADGKIVGICRR